MIIQNINSQNKNTNKLMTNKNPLKFSPKKELILPEYGKNIQHLVEFAITIEDKEQRTLCADTIIGIMGNMFPHLRDVEGFKHKLWVHLAIMSDFKLDIDYPFEIKRQDNLYEKPDKIPYSTGNAKYSHYGKTVEKLIAAAQDIDDTEQKEQLTLQICHYLKKSLIEWNREIATDQKVINDIQLLSENRLSVSEDTVFAKPPQYNRGRDNSRRHKPTNGKKRYVKGKK